MPALRPVVTVRSATFISALLMSTAFTTAAYAQIETVIVTAERKAEDIQTVPIAVSAFTNADLQSHQITTFRDLQFSVPNVTVSNANFGSANFQIRGIGSAFVGTSGDNGVSVNTDEIYLDEPALASATYYDLDRIEVLRGPQPTNYGRNATGGAINVVTAKPNLDTFSVGADLQYGNFNDREARGVINVPVIDGVLAVRVAAFGELRSGDIKNIYGNGLPSSLDSRDDYSTRAAIRFQPNDDTTFDLMWQHSAESDSRVRAVVQSCHRDPSGVLGCLPDKRAAEPINLNATLAYTFPSEIGLLGNPVAIPGTFGQVHLNNLQLTQISGAAGAPGAGATVTIPSDLHTVNSDFQPVTKGHDDFVDFKVHQKLGDWLTADILLGFDQSFAYTSQGYSDTPPEPFSAPLASNAITPSQATALAFLGGPAHCPAAAATTNRLVAVQEIFTCLFPTSGSKYFVGHFGTLPISQATPGGFGLIAGNLRDYGNHFESYDEGDGAYREWTQELRFSTNFNGPLNFLLGGYHITTRHVTDYYVNSTALDFASIAVGAVLAHDGLFLGPSNYNNRSDPYTLESTSVYGEMYYDILPDTLKFTGGFRYTEDDKAASSQNTLQNCLLPVNIPAALVTAQFFASCAPTPVSSAALVREQSSIFHSLTGRAVLNWTPKLDFTDQTLVYASYTHGNRPGGFNPPSKSIPPLFSSTFNSEELDSYEIGTKNTLLDGLLQANLTAWYYDYSGYQISKIVDRTSVNANINSRLWGVEGEFFWAPIDNLQFNLSFGYTNSEITSGSDFDTRNPSQNDPNATVVKDYAGANCVITNALHTGPVTPATNPFFAAILVNPPVTSLPGTAARVAFLNGSGSIIPATQGLSCNTLDAALLATFGAASPYRATPGGLSVSLKGNEMPNTPPLTFNIGAQYTINFGSGYTVVPRVDYYWKDRMFAGKFNAPTDLIQSWDELNAQIQLNAPDNKWYVRGFIRNVIDSQNITGSYVTDPSSGLFTNLFVEEPRTYGLTIGAHL
jgi:iron complex outermembrane recepter protein